MFDFIYIFFYQNKSIVCIFKVTLSGITYITGKPVFMKVCSIIYVICTHLYDPPLYTTKYIDFILYTIIIYEANNTKDRRV